MDTKKIEDNLTEKVAGGTEEKKIGCELCGERGEYEYYYITIKFKDGIESLGRKKICLACRDSHCMKYIKENYPGRALDTVRMEGPLAI